MATSIQAIETRYKGYRFRSRLEARWAVFFDHLGLSWDYEYEGFDLGIAGQPGDQVNFGWYLPDFEINHAIFVEIKPLFVPGALLRPEDEVRFLESGMIDALVQLPRLSELTGKQSLLICGSPWPGDYHIHLFPDYPGDEAIGPLEFADCRRCDGLGVENERSQIAIICRCDGAHWKGTLLHGERVMSAFHAARAERFGS